MQGKRKALQRIFQNMIQNTDIMDILEGNSITVIPGSYNGFLSQAQITSGWKDYPGNEKKYYYFAELKMDDEKDDNLPQIEDILRNNEAIAAIGEPNPSDSYMILLWQIGNIDESIYPYVIKIEENEFFPKAVMNDFDKMVLLSQQKEQNQPADADKVLAQMTKARRTFIDQYNHAVEMGKFNPNKCPLYREL